MKHIFIFLIWFLGSFNAFAAVGDALHLFTDVSLFNDSGRTHTQIHGIDLFISDRIDQNLSYLAEIVFEPSAGEMTVDAERTYLQYSTNPLYKIIAGRFHTPIGYWNDTFHHGTYFQTTAQRPRMEAFEDDGGLLPAHSTGVILRGDGNQWGYALGFGDGRGPVKTPASSFLNYNAGLSAMSMIYGALDSGWRLGASFYFSQLPGGAVQSSDSSTLIADSDSRPGAVYSGSGPVVGPKGLEYIGGIHLVYLQGPLEWINEYNYVKHTYDPNQLRYDGSLAVDTGTHLMYTQLAYMMTKWKPYFRYELDAPDAVDAYFNAYTGHINPGLLGTLTYYTLGVRYELTESSALKFELIYASSTVALEQQYGFGAAVLDRKDDFSTHLNWSVAW